MMRRCGGFGVGRARAGPIVGRPADGQGAGAMAKTGIRFRAGGLAVLALAAMAIAGAGASGVRGSGSGAVSGVVSGVVSAQDEVLIQPGRRAAFMRQKLDFSKDLLQGLALEDFEMIADRARSMRKLSEAVEWETVVIPGTDYARYNLEFQNLSADLGRQAAARNLDGAIIAFNQLTLNCVQCHKFVRLQAKKG